MCGRTASSRGPAALARITGARIVGRSDFRANYNIAPTTYVPVIRRLRGGASHEERTESGAGEQKEEEREAEDAETRPVDLSGQDAIILQMKWGLVPSYSKDSAQAYSMINARSDRLTSSGVYRRLLERRRCVIPVDGFYEWHAGTNQFGQEKKTPHFVQMKPDEKGRHRVMFLAGLWDRWYKKRSENAEEKGKTKKEESKQQKAEDGADAGEKDADGESGKRETKEEDDEDVDEEKFLYSCTIITTDASQELGWLHNRMPVVLDEEGARQWLDTKSYNFKQVAHLLKPCPPGQLQWHEVSQAVNRLANKSRECIEQAATAKEKSIAKGIGRFFSSPARKKAEPKDEGGAEKAEEKSGDDSGKRARIEPAKEGTKEELAEGTSPKRMRETAGASKPSPKKRGRTASGGKSSGSSSGKQTLLTQMMGNAAKEKGSQ